MPIRSWSRSRRRRRRRVAFKQPRKRGTQWKRNRESLEPQQQYGLQKLTAILLNVGDTAQQYNNEKYIHKAIHPDTEAYKRCHTY